ncbi:hypothetical protein [Leuconostoc rapi]|uniref:hypothetical protein n=1 Tax=Leuconostoc rapi TaxID=1406906 RepID=UPI00195B6429|nr:hypothetical protein [Leuconostoc rapi]MBM7436461.1 glutamate racemase [Leuconostoc rapi]
MKKIIFEQVSNMILAILLACAAASTIAGSNINTDSSDYLVDIHFDKLWLVFILAAFIFTVLRYGYSKYLGKHDGYDAKNAEFSYQDEREKLISQHATKITYQFMTNILAASIIVLVFCNALTNSIFVLRLIPVILIAICLILMFFVYLVAWIVYDHKL